MPGLNQESANVLTLYTGHWREPDQEKLIGTAIGFPVREIRNSMGQTLIYLDSLESKEKFVLRIGDLADVSVQLQMISLKKVFPGIKEEVLSAMLGMNSDNFRKHLIEKGEYLRKAGIRFKFCSGDKGAALIAVGNKTKSGEPYNRSYRKWEERSVKREYMGKNSPKSVDIMFA